MGNIGEIVGTIEITKIESILWLKMVKAYRAKVDGRKDSFEKTAILMKIESLMEKLAQV